MGLEWVGEGNRLERMHLRTAALEKLCSFLLRASVLNRCQAKQRPPVSLGFLLCKMGRLWLWLPLRRASLGKGHFILITLVFLAMQGPLRSAPEYSKNQLVLWALPAGKTAFPHSTSKLFTAHPGQHKRALAIFRALPVHRVLSCVAQPC